MCADLQIPRDLLKTTPNLDSVVEHLVATSKCSMFALNHRYVELCIMDVKICCDLFNTLVRSTTSYTCEKIKVIEVVYRKFLKSLLEVQNTTSTSIVLA
jgi:hypothetical protein